MRPSYTAFALLISAAGLSACTTTGGSFLVDPARYMLFSCNELYREIDNEKRREITQRNLMAKAVGSPGGELVSLTTYRLTYEEALENQRLANARLKEKRCPPPGTR